MVLINKRKLLVFIIGLVCFSFIQTQAQIGVQLSYLYPNREYDFGYVLKPTVGISITTNIPIGKKFSIGASAGFYPFKTRQDTFKTVTYKDDGGNITILPGYDKFKNNSYYMIPFFITSEYKFLKKPLSPMVGFDVGMQYITYTHDYATVTLNITSNEQENFLSFDMFPKVGIVYNYNKKVSFTFGIGYNITVFTNDGISHPYTNTFLSILFHTK